MLGFYTSLVPSLIKNALAIGSHAVDGAIVFEMYVFAIATVILMRDMPARKAMMIGLGLLLPSLGLLVLDEAGTVAAGFAVRLGTDRGRDCVRLSRQPAGRQRDRPRTRRAPSCCRAISSSLSAAPRCR